MSIISFETKTYKSGALLLSSRPNLITIRIHKIGSKHLKECYVPLDLLDDVKQIKNHTALVAFAKANQITDSATDAHCYCVPVTPCPVPAPAPAKSAAKEQGILFVEFQTSGCGKDTEIIEISVVDSSENVLFQSLIKPTKPIKEDSTKQHGINNAHVIESPSFADVWKSFSAVIGRSDIAFYNADFSKRIILQSIAKAFDTPIPKHFYTLFPYNKVICVGEQYKDFNNFRLGYFRNNGLQHINSACGQSGVLWRDLSKSSSGSAIKSARLYKYLDHKAVA